jgi:hypothetical protein
VATSSSSSAKKVAKLAQRGKGKKVRFQGGSLFPVVVLAVIVLGLLTIVYARQSRPDAGSQPPQVNDHWHAAYGMYVCDTWLPTLDGNKETGGTNPDGTPGADQEFAVTGVHSHDDGVIHWHPYSSKSVGNRARLGLFLEIYDVELSTDELKLPAEQGGNDYQADDFQCDGKDVQITVTAWTSYTDTGKGTTNITDFDNVKLKNDGMVFTIAVTPPGTEIPMPPWAKNLPALGAADGTGATTTVATDDTATADTATGDTTTDATTGDTTSDTATDDTATDDTATDDTATDDTATGDTATDETTDSATTTTGG